MHGLYYKDISQYTLSSHAILSLPPITNTAGKLFALCMIGGCYYTKDMPYKWWIRPHHTPLLVHAICLFINGHDTTVLSHALISITIWSCPSHGMLIYHPHTSYDRDRTAKWNLPRTYAFFAIIIIIYHTPISVLSIAAVLRIVYIWVAVGIG